MARYNAITPEEVSYIVSHIGDMKFQEIAAALGRSYYTICRVARSLGFSQIHKWTREEDAYLLSHYGQKSAGHIAARLGVDVNSVYNRARRLRGAR